MRKFKCIKDLIMAGGDVALIEGNIYEGVEGIEEGDITLLHQNHDLTKDFWPTYLEEIDENVDDCALDINIL